MTQPDPPERARPEPVHHEQTPLNPKCPFHSSGTASITRLAPTHRKGAIPMHHLHDYASSREVLRNSQAVQAGFQADSTQAIPGSEHVPVLFMEGAEHTELRRATAKYFTPTRVNTYQPMIAQCADQLVAKLVQQGFANIDDLSLELAVKVVAQVVGLTNSLVPGMGKRLEILTHASDGAPGVQIPSNTLTEWRWRSRVLAFFYLDVKPAIEARRKQPRDDVISFLLQRQYKDIDILTEMIMYGTAGMVTTREFISVAAYHLLQNRELRNDYLHSLETERHDILQEILRLEPVVNTLYRRASADLKVNGEIIPQGTIFAIDVQKANADPQLLGETAEQLCPHRNLSKSIGAAVLSFGDGHHRCAGSFLAIKESDIFLRRLLMLQDLRIVRYPDISYNETVKGYELRGFRVQVGH